MRRMLIVFLLLCASPALAEEEKKEGWSLTSANSLQLSQVALSNWAAGGENSITVNTNFFAELGHNRGRRFSQLIANWQVGLYKAEDERIQKSADHLILVAVTGYNATPKLAIGVLADLTTQVAPSYERDPGFVAAFNGSLDDGIKIGSFLSPGYIEGGAGLRYVNENPSMELIFTPLGIKETVILDDDIRAIDAALPDGLYGNNGEKIRSEVGISLRMRNKIPLATNISADSNLKAFVRYGESDIDVSWVLKVTGKINKYISASVHTTALYDKNVDTDLSTPGKQEKIQIREVFGVELSYAFHL